MQHFKSMRDVEPKREVRQPYEGSLCGADQRIARSAETVAWLGKVYGELAGNKRDWPMFAPRELKAFLHAAGVDCAAAVKADLDAMPIPEDLHSPELCFAKLRGASFLTMPAEVACLRLNERQAQVLARG